jgi:hypothetical protein
MDYKDVGSLGDEGSPADVDLLIAAVTLVVVDNFPFDHLEETLLHGLDVFDWQRQVVEVLYPILHLAALLAHHLTACLSSEDRLQQVLP